MKELQTFFPGSSKKRVSNFLLGRPIMPQISENDAKNIQDRSSFQQFRKRMANYIEIHKIHFLKDALLAIGFFSSINAQLNSVTLAAIASAVPLLGIIAHGYHWGQAEGEILHAENVYKQELEREEIIRRKIGPTTSYTPQPPKDRSALN